MGMIRTCFVRGLSGATDPMLTRPGVDNWLQAASGCARPCTAASPIVSLRSASGSRSWVIDMPVYPLVPPCWQHIPCANDITPRDPASGLTTGGKKSVLNL